MPTISQLPVAGEVSAADEIPISQQGSVCAVSVGNLLAGVQPAILAPTGVLLGRISLGPGGPDPVSVGTGLTLSTGTLMANGTDHAAFPTEPTLTMSDDVVLSSGGSPKLMEISLLRGLYSAGANITIDANGTISASTSAPALDFAALPTIPAASAGDLIAINQGSTNYAISYANLIDGQTVDEIQGAGAASDSDWLLVGQGSSSLLRQTLAAIWAWLTTKLPGYLQPTLEISTNTALATTTHNDHLLLCSQPVTITAASSDLGSGFSCGIINASGGNIVLGSNIATSSGTSILAAGQSATLTCVTYSGGNLVYASISSPTASASPPVQVNSLAAATVTSSSVALNWPALSVAPTSYVVQYRVSGSSSWSNAPSVTSPSCVVMGLLPGTSYDFVALAINGAGAGPASAIITVATLASLTVPGQVGSVNVSSNGPDSLLVSWSAPSSGGPVASYTVDFRLTGSSAWTTAATSIAATSYTASALSASTSYDFQVYAVNAAGSGVASTTVTSSTSATGGSVTAITWNVVPSGSYTHGSGTIAVNAHITPSSAPIQFAFSTSATTPPTSWTAGNYVNSDLWGAYVAIPSVPGTYYAWAEGTDGSLPTAYPTGFTVT